MNSDNKHPEYQYLDLMKDILKNGTDKPLFLTPEVQVEYKKKREPLPHIRSVFGRMIRFDLAKGFPLLTTKKVFFRGIAKELLWFISGSSNIKYLVDNDVHIWDEWAWKAYHKYCIKNCPRKDLGQDDFIAKLKQKKPNSIFVKKWGDLVTIYGRMWRRWPAKDGREIDQLSWVIKGLKEAPYRKSYLVSTWNPDFIYDMASRENKNEVPPFCHTTFQFAQTNNRLNLAMFQRSADLFLGVPFNIASYALLLLIVSQVVGMKPGEFVHFFGDVHIYSNHFKQVKEQLKRKPYPFPKVKLNPNIKDIDKFKFKDIKLINYKSHSRIRAEVVNVGGYNEKKK